MPSICSRAYCRSSAPQSKASSTRRISCSARPGPRRARPGRRAGGQHVGEPGRPQCPVGDVGAAGTRLGVVGEHGRGRGAAGQLGAHRDRPRQPWMPTIALSAKFGSGRDGARVRWSALPWPQPPHRAPPSSPHSLPSPATAAAVVRREDAHALKAGDRVDLRADRRPGGDDRAVVDDDELAEHLGHVRLGEVATCRRPGTAPGDRRTAWAGTARLRAPRTAGTGGCAPPGR